jgi:hypothetical protein
MYAGVFEPLASGVKNMKLATELLPAYVSMTLYSVSSSYMSGVITDLLYDDLIYD